jgi:hypothetical protein
MPMLPSVARVRVEVGRDRVVVIEDINLPRGDWRGGDLDLYAAFGAPGTPIAVDAHLLAVPEGASEPGGEEPGETASVQAAIRRSPGTTMLLGKPQMAGFVVRLKEASLRRTLSGGDLATLRLRTLLPPPVADDEGARDLVVRLGVFGGLPMTIGRIQVVSLEKPPWLSRGEARLCGPEADPWPLSVSVLPRPPAEGRTGPANAIAPSQALRHASDDLCIRWWARP